MTTGKCCGLCGGDGFVTEDQVERFGVFWREGMFLDGRTETCPLCEGSGEDPFQEWPLGASVLAAVLIALLFWILMALLINHTLCAGSACP